ncbi:MAG: CopG family transcriptional regulator [Firmicutes bacterium]|nr:CopG family transcriptional regulator [Bacillota bacterium]
MVRTQIQLTEEQAVALRRLAVLQGVPIAELVRRGVEMVINSDESIEKKKRFAKAKEVAGRFQSGLPDLAVRHDDYFAEDSL